MRAAPFLILFLLLSFNVHPQVHKGFRWIGPDQYLYSVDTNSGMLQKESPQKSKTELGIIKNWENIKKELPGDFDINAFYQKDKSILLTIPGTGQLYRLNLKELQLARLDKTYFRGYNFNANQFVRKDTLFSVGGEGFWNQHSVITFYNPKTSEWDIYASANKNPYATIDDFSGYSSQYDAFFSLPLMADHILEKQDVYFSIYDFKQKKWEIKGEANQDLLEFAKNKLRGVWTGEYLVLFKQDGRGAGDIRIVDPFNNILYRYDVPDNNFFTQNCEVYASNGYLFSRNLVSTGSNDFTFFDSLSVKSLVKDSKQLGQVYETGYLNFKNVLIFILVLLSGIAGYKYFFSREHQLNLTQVELQVIQALIQLSNGEKLSSADLNSLLQLENKTYDNQRQIRTRIIQTINQKLFTYLGSKELILRSSNSEDKRMMEYHINPEIRFKDVEKLYKSLQI